MKKLRIKPQIGVIVFLVISFLWIFCQKVPTPLVPEGKGISLKIEDVGVTEAWLKINLRLYGEDFVIKILRNNRLLFSQSAAKLDTIVCDSTLLPLHTYRYRAEVWQGAHRIDRSKELSITTMDTTSHDFEWQTFEFGGQGGSSYFKDVAIIDENDIWAVGEIYTADDKYNAAHWDGEKWELKKITYGGWFWKINTVFAFSHSDVWFSAFVKWNGSRFIEYPVPKVLTGYGLNKIWGTSDHDLYVVGNNGLIAHYDGRQWTRIESGTDLGLTDVWGVSENEMYAVGLHYGQLRGVVLKIKDGRCQTMIEGFPTFQVDPEELFVTKIYGTTEGVWLDEKGTVYIVGNLMYQYKLGNWDYVRSLPENYPGGNSGNYYRGYLHAVRGNASNDIFIFGESNTIIHFNGMSWRRIGPPYMPWSYHFWYKCDVKGDIIVGVGKTSGMKARIIKLWHSP